MLIQEIRDRIQFLITVEIFFSTVVYVFYKTIGSSDILANNNALFWGIGVAFCIVNYLMIGAVDEAFKKTLTLIKWSVSLNIACFILPMILLVFIAKNPVSAYYKIPFVISLYGAIWIPVATSFFISVALTKIFKK